jgi:hypothetical protein
MKWFFRWWLRHMQHASEDTTQEARTMGQVAATRHFDGGMNFQLVDAENGKILKVQVPDPSNKQSFHPMGGTKEKLWVIPEGEDVMTFVTRALVEERIK